MSHKTFTVEIDRRLIQDKLDVIANDDRVMLQINNELARIINPWVPFLEGPLSQDLDITPQGITYLQPYATRQYYGDDFNHTKDYHPLASARWDEVAMTVKRDEFERIVEKIVKKRLGELYGR